MREKYAVWLDTGLWRCPKCGEWSKAGKLYCWNCGERRKETDLAVLHEGHTYFPTEEGSIGDYEKG